MKTQELPISTDLFLELMKYFEEIHVAEKCDSKTHTYTRRFLKEKGIDEETIESFCEFCKENGGYCDCEIMYNPLFYVFDD
jgi:hypothetical protein